MTTSASPSIRGLMRNNLVRGALAVLCAAGAFTALQAPPARAAVRRTVCAQNLYVRDSPMGIVIGTLYSGQSINVERYSPSGEWAYGFAYGEANKYGWVQNGWFCN